MIWGFLPPGFLVALLRSWHATPYRDETVLLASYQRPADSMQSPCVCSLVCEKLFLAAFRLHSAFLLFLIHQFLVFHISHSDCRIIYPPLRKQTLLFFSPWFPFWIFGLGKPVPLLLNNLLFLALAETLQPGWLVQLLSVSWMRGNKRWPIIHHTTKGNNSN